MHIRRIGRASVSLGVLIGLCLTGTSIAAPGGGAPKCSGAWTGTISYKRTQSTSNSETVERVSRQGQDTTESRMNFDYSAQISVAEAPEKNGSSIGRANIHHLLTGSESVSASELNRCGRDPALRTMTGQSTSTSQTRADATGQPASVSVNVNPGGTYTVGVGLPSIRGMAGGSQSSTYSGQCTPKEGGSYQLPETEVEVDGQSLSSDGTNKVDPSNPDKLSGSYSKSYQNVTETINWNLRKCGGPLQILDIKFADMKFPDWNSWRDADNVTGTIDGNIVRITARVLNASGEEKSATLKMKLKHLAPKNLPAEPDELIKDGSVSFALAPGEEQDIEFLWDSSGYAWSDSRYPQQYQNFKAVLEENDKKIDELSDTLKISPRPVVLVHGLWSDWRTWSEWQGRLASSHSHSWKAYPVGQNPAQGVMNTGEFMSASPTNSIDQNAEELGRYIKYAQEQENAWHVDIVAHSMGGLISRRYIHQLMPAPYQDGKPQVAHLVMLGTPNQGSPCADIMSFAFEVTGKNVRAMRELRQDFAAEFNRVNVNRKGVQFSILAGNKVPTICYSLTKNDGVVTVPSAFWTISDHFEVSRLHTDLTGAEDFSRFVLPHLAVGPKGAAAPVPDYTEPVLRIDNRWSNERPHAWNGFNPRSKILSVEQILLRGFVAEQEPSAGNGMAPSTSIRPDFAQSETVEPGEAVEMTIPVADARNFGVTFMAAAEISATLIDAAGQVVGNSRANTPEARQWFRSIFVNRPVQAGMWTLKLENVSTRPLEAVIATWSNAQ